MYSQVLFNTFFNATLVKLFIDFYTVKKFCPIFISVEVKVQLVVGFYCKPK